MSVRVLVELSTDLPRPYTERLVRAAYRASRCGPVALVLHGVDPATIDAILDAEVVATGIDVPGVVYVRGDDEALVASARQRAEVVITCTDMCRAATTPADCHCAIEEAEKRLGAFGWGVATNRSGWTPSATTTDALHAG